MPLVIPSQNRRRMRKDPAALAQVRGLQRAAMRTTRVLGTHPGPVVDADKQGDRATGLTGVNTGQGGNVEAQQARGRVNAKFRIALTSDGRIVHLYGQGNELQRQVLNEQQSQSSMARNPMLAKIAAQQRGHNIGAGPGGQQYVNPTPHQPGDPRPTKLGPVVTSRTNQPTTQGGPIVTSRTNQPTTSAAQRRARRRY
jgi:hypothetical protein